MNFTTARGRLLKIWTTEWEQIDGIWNWKQIVVENQLTAIRPSLRSAMFDSIRISRSRSLPNGRCVRRAVDSSAYEKRARGDEDTVFHPYRDPLDWSRSIFRPLPFFLSHPSPKGSSDCRRESAAVGLAILSSAACHPRLSAFDPAPSRDRRHWAGPTALLSDLSGQRYAPAPCPGGGSSATSAFCA